MFGTAAMRERVLAAWTAAPARFREDANAEEELVHGAYRDRVIVELAQNAADAAARAGVSGRLLLSLRGSTLVASNTGAPLDEAGVEALSTLRASAKSDDEGAVGRFGVGFAAVLAVTDEPSVSSARGGVRWSRAAVIDEVRQIPQLAAELARRGRAVPVLRLPFEIDGWVPPEYDTAVVLPLRDQAATDMVRTSMAAVDDALLLTLPALGEIVTEIDDARRVMSASDPIPIDASGRVTEREIDDRRWRLATSTTLLSPETLIERPTEERARLDRAATVAVPVTDDAPAAVPRSIPQVLHAPTPTDDRTALPVLVIADLPLDSSRRRVAAGQVTERLIDTVASAYVTLVTSFDHPDVLALIPGPMGAGEVDAELHRAVRDVLAGTPFVPRAGGPDAGSRLRPRNVTLLRGLEPADGSPLARVVSGLPRRGWGRGDGLRRLGARELSLADFVDELASVPLEPAEWPDVYDALSGLDPAELGSLPVPLADGRVVRGARGLLVAGEVESSTLQRLGLRVVDQRAEHPLILRLGASSATASSVLDHPRTRAAVEQALESDDDIDELTEAVLALVRASGQTHEQYPWLGLLEFPDRTGAFAAAYDLVLPQSPVLDVMERPAEFAVAEHVVDRYGVDALRAVGVRSGLSVLRRDDLVLDDVTDLDLDDVEGWRAAVEHRVPQDDVLPIVAEFTAIRDLDTFRDDAWPEALLMIAADPAARAAVTQPVNIMLGDGARVTMLSYSSWWLSTHARLGGLSLSDHAGTDADPVVSSLLPPLPPELDVEFGAAVGGARQLRDADTQTLLERLADQHIELDADALALVYTELGAREASLPRPRHVRVPDHTGSRVVDAATAVVVDAPYWLQLVTGSVIVARARLAELLGVATARDTYDARVETVGATVAVPTSVYAIIPEAASHYVEHDDLRVGGTSVDWWIDDGTVHAATVQGLAYGLAWSAGRWRDRWQVVAVLDDPSSLESILLEKRFPP